ncbi:MAG: hypothetical protein OEW98_03370 [Betaproteobacteria bacterium]|nr:hypothetical protein [Betaproteobacteria bacterium]
MIDCANAGLEVIDISRPAKPGLEVALLLHPEPMIETLEQAAPTLGCRRRCVAASGIRVFECSRLRYREQQRLRDQGEDAKSGRAVRRQWVGSHWKSFSSVSRLQTLPSDDGASHKPNIGTSSTFVKSAFWINGIRTADDALTC